MAGGFSLWLGTAWTPSSIPKFREELRPFLQVLGEHQFGAFKLINRFRFEERFIQDARGMSLRVRHMVRGVYKLGDTRFSLAAYEELFIKLNPIVNGPVQGIDQNRSFIGINRAFSVGPSTMILEVGYLATYVIRTPNPPRLNHTPLIWLAFNFP